MKKAAFYARVSSDQQKNEGTIESQIEALKKQIIADGNVLVKEYSDNGLSGARFDRPALDELRKDLKTNIFDTIYFLAADRISRTASYQSIIISEIIKNKKQLIIGGKDYVENPENHFALQIFAAVSELERAKIIERSVRGRQYKLRQGVLICGGALMYGYNYIRKTPTSPARVEINEKEAEVVKFIFAEYAKGNRSMNSLSRQLEEMDVHTKRGNKLWGYSALQNMLKRGYTYAGTRYFNAVRVITDYGNPLTGTKTTKKVIYRDRSEWIGIPVPAIISKETLEKVHERIAWNKKRYRNPKKVQLLSSLIRCGHCGSGFYAYHRYMSKKHTDGSKKISHKAAYRCCRHAWRLGHSKIMNYPRCESTEKASHILEGNVFAAIEETLFDPIKLHACIDIFKTERPHARMERELQQIEKRLRMYRERKQRMTDIYVAGNFPREEYVTKSRAYDDEVLTLATRKIDILRQIPLFRKTALVDMCIQQYCETTKLRYKKAVDFETKRQFLLDYIERVTYWNDRISVHGSISVTMKSEHGREAETSKVEFRIEMKTGIHLSAARITSTDSSNASKS